MDSGAWSARTSGSVHSRSTMLKTISASASTAIGSSCNPRSRIRADRAFAISACTANSLPWSQASDRRSSADSCPIAATLALDGHRTYALGWLAATVCSAAVLLLPGSLEGRVVASLAVGPVVGIAIHALWVGRALQRRR